MEPESELTVTELKAERERKLLEREMAEKERIRLEEEKKKRQEEEGIDWGMGKTISPSYILQTSSVLSEIST